ncbi:MAG: tyrosine-type recombinase/integrase [Actinomycetota bacterium]|nr:tyrosine-type recombinase/integrase [Actinomycetota bacterium]
MDGIYLGEVTPSKSVGKAKHDHRASKTFLGCFGQDRLVSSLNRRDWDRFIQERRRGAIGPSGRAVGDRQVEYDLKFLLSVFNWALNAGNQEGGSLLDRNPFSGFRLPREDSPNRVMLVQEDYEAMLSVAGQVDWRFSTALVLAHETGHRIGAVRQLRWSDIDAECLLVRWRKANDKIGMAHETPLTEAALHALGRARKHNPGIGEAWVFPAPKNASEACSRHLMTNWWSRAERLAGLEHVKGCGWHSLRRKFATELKHTPLTDLCEMGGWKDPQTVLKCYQRPDAKTQRLALENRKPVTRAAFGI